MPSLKSFYFDGEVEASKSIFNRLLCIQFHFPNLELRGNSASDDVKAMKDLLNRIREKNRVLYAGEAGTVFRFGALCASRVPGSWIIKGTPRLLARPQQELISILGQLGVRSDLTPEGLRIEGEGWRPPGILKVDMQKSSQFASGVVLNSWGLDFDLDLQLSQELASEDYFSLSLSLCEQLGMQIIKERRRFLIPRNQKVKFGKPEHGDSSKAVETASKPKPVEIDCSSAAFLLVAGALYGFCRIQNWPQSSLQPDHRLLEVLEKFGLQVTRSKGSCAVEKANGLRGIRWNFANCPDLVPPLSVLAAFAEGRSEFSGLGSLVYKESNRVARIQELLKLAGVGSELSEDTLSIQGQGPNFVPKHFIFDPDQDHRMAMAAGLLQISEPAIEVLHPQVVAKSFPGFWQIIRDSIRGVSR